MANEHKKLHLLPPFALKLSKIKLNNARSNGPDTNINGHLRSPSNLSANKTYKNVIANCDPTEQQNSATNLIN